MKSMNVLAFAALTGAALGSATAIAAAGHVVSQKGKAFSMSTLSISIGDTVTFRNDDKVKHNILIKDIDFNSGIQEQGVSSDATFKSAGKFTVRCGIHPKMKMTVTVN